MAPRVLPYVLLSQFRIIVPFQASVGTLNPAKEVTDSANAHHRVPKNCSNDDCDCPPAWKRLALWSPYGCNQCSNDNEQKCIVPPDCGISRGPFEGRPCKRDNEVAEYGRPGSDFPQWNRPNDMKLHKGNGGADDRHHRKPNCPGWAKRWFLDGCLELRC